MIASVIAARSLGHDKALKARSDDVRVGRRQSTGTPFHSLFAWGTVALRDHKIGQGELMRRRW